jgi:hypothetical protein
MLKKNSIHIYKFKYNLTALHMLYFDATQILNSRIIVSVRGYEAEERALLELSNLLLGFGDAIVVT